MRNKIQKASDVFKNSNFVFASKTDSFDKAFPNIEDVKVELKEYGEDVDQWSHNRTYSKQYFPGEYIDCSNKLCYNGGISIGSIIRDMIYNKQTEFETSKLCQGHEGSPKGRRIYRKCLNSFELKVSLKYKPI